MFNYIKFDLFLMSFIEWEWNKWVEWESTTQKPETTSELSDLDKKILELKTQILEARAWTKIVWQRTQILEQKSVDNISMLELQENWAYDINETVIRLKAELWQLEERKKVLERTLEVTKDNKLTPEELNKMKKIKDQKEFLSMNTNERLRYITKWNIESKEVTEWWVKDIEFTFTYDWEFNRNLYLRTTAWQVLNETVRKVECDWVEFSRKWYNWEFFAENWKRLLIHEWTKISVTKFWTEEELKASLEWLSSLMSFFKWTPNEAFALETLKKWYDPKFVLWVFWDKLNWLEWEAKNIEMEDILSDIARLEDDFKDDFPNEKTEKDGKISEKFAWYVINTLVKKGETRDKVLENISKEYWFDLDSLKSSRRINNVFLWWWPINMENISLNADKDYPNWVESLLAKRNFRPWSKDASVLFLVACQAANLPLEWCNKESLHRLLAHESNWVVWRLNYTIKHETPSSFKEKAVSSSSKNPIWVTSTASWLGQLLLENVDKYYPDWRDWIWDPLNEAVWMLRYIKDRYWSPDVAWQIYGKTWSFVHPEKWQQYKWFEEWY